MSGQKLNADLLDPRLRGNDETARRLAERGEAQQCRTWATLHSELFDSELGFPYLPHPRIKCGAGKNGQHGSVFAATATPLRPLAKKLLCTLFDNALAVSNMRIVWTPRVGRMATQRH